MTIIQLPKKAGECDLILYNYRTEYYKDFNKLYYKIELFEERIYLKIQIYFYSISKKRGYYEKALFVFIIHHSINRLCKL